MPELYIITGSNGAGKSSIGSNYLPSHIRTSCVIFDGDKLFMQKQKELWQSGLRAHKEAKKIAFEFVSNTFDELTERALTDVADFAYEGHFTNEATWDVPKRFKANGYAVHLIFLGLSDTSLSELRVIARTKEGGHYVNPLTIADNFYGNLEKLNKHFALFDTLQIIDTSETRHIKLATYREGVLAFSISYDQLPAWFSKYLPKLAEQIKK